MLHLNKKTISHRASFSRRSLLQVIAALVAPKSFAKGVCKETGRSTGEFIYRVDNDYPSNFSSQPDDFNWCWAACIENILMYHGMVGITQQEIVTRTYGATLNVGGFPDQAIRGMWRDHEGNMFEVTPEYVFGLGSDLDLSFTQAHWPVRNAICANSPIITCYEIPRLNIRHAVLLVGASGMYKNYFEDVLFDDVLVFNPWGYYEKMSQEAIEGIVYGFSVKVKQLS